MAAAPSPGRLRRWQAAVAPPALLIILCLLFFHTALVGPYVFPWDFTAAMYPAQRFVDSSIRAGEFPLWDPYVMSGYPIIGDPQAAIFNPLFLLYHLMPGLPVLPLRIFELMEVLYIASAGVFTYFLASQTGIRPLGSFFAGLVYMLGGFFPIHVEHETWVVATAWVPLLLLLAIRLTDRARPRDVAAISLIVALSVFSGYPQTTLLSIYLLLFWLAWQAVGWVRERRHAVALQAFLDMGGALILGLGISAIQLLPTAALALQTSRATMNVAGDVAGSLQPGAPISLLLPQVFGSDGSFAYLGGEVTQTQKYSGLAPLIFTLIGIVAWPRWRSTPFAPRRQAHFFLALVVLAFLGSLGPQFYLYRVFKLLPLMALFRRPATLFPFALLGMAIVGGAVCDSLSPTGPSNADLHSRPPRTIDRNGAFDPARWAFALAVLLGAFYVFGSLQPEAMQAFFRMFRGNPALQRIAEPSFAPTLRRVFQDMLPASLVLVGLLAAATRPGRMRPFIAFAIIGFTYMDLYSSNAGKIFNASSTNSIETPVELPGIQTIRAAGLGEYRIGQDRYLYSFNMANVLQVEDMSGYNPLTLRRVNEFLSAIPSVNSRLFDALNVRYLLLTKRYFESSDRSETIAGNAAARGTDMMYLPDEALDPDKFVFRQSAYYDWYQLWENKNALPRFWAADQHRVIPDSRQRLLTLSEAGFDPGQEVILEEPPQGSFGGHLDGRVNLVSYRLNSFEITASVVGGGTLLFISVPYFRDWHAWVDGRPAHIYIADHAFMALHLEPGAHTIRLAFEPMAFALGGWVTGVSLAVWLLLLATPPGPGALSRRLGEGLRSMRHPRSLLRRFVSSALVRLATSEKYQGAMARVLATLAPVYVSTGRHGQYFQFWEEHGFHLTPVHYYQPIPDTRTFDASSWDRESELSGVDLNDRVQLRFLHEIFPRFPAEYNQFAAAPTDCPYEYHFDNKFFGGTDALVLYCMVRHLQPKLIVEVGAGFSSRVSARAARLNGGTHLICIEPYPDEVLSQGFPGLTTLIREKVQNVGLDLFRLLGADDILFIDSTHVVQWGSDVNYLFLEVLPRLKAGVVVHVHDVFFPREYPRKWLEERHLFWSEQYLLQAFLAFNSEFEVLFSNSYMGLKHPAAMRAAFPNSPWWGGGSFWMRRKVG